MSRPKVTDERGSGTGLVAAICVVLAMVFTVLAWLVAWSGSAQRARDAADLAALAGSHAQVDGLDACRAAEQNAAANDSAVLSCTVEVGATGEFIVAVSVAVDLRPQVELPGAPSRITASARAGAVETGDR